MITIKTEKEISAMREGGKILAGIMKEVGDFIAIGKSTQDLDELAEKLVFSHGGVPAFKGYEVGKAKAYPATLCVSLNDEVVHGIPKSKRIIQDGDLVKIDIGMRYKNMVTDMARTFAVGKVSTEARKLLETTKNCLEAGIAKLNPGESLNAYARAVESLAEKENFSVVRELVGHGVGRELHEDPFITNFSSNENGRVILKEGMTLALEPMINVGTERIKIGKDKWVFKTLDGKLSAHFEDTVVIGKNGAEILTR